MRYISKEDLSRAAEENHCKFWCSIGVETHVSSQLTEVITGIAHPLLNSVLISKFSEKDADNQISKIIEDFRKRNLPFCWWINRLSTPLDMNQRLEKFGMSFLGVFPGMSIHLDRVQVSTIFSPELVIEPVDASTELEKWGDVLQVVFQSPNEMIKKYVDIYRKVGLKPFQPFRHFIGKINGEPVATSTLFIDGEVAGIYNLTVLPSARGKGVANAMVLDLLMKAQQQNCQIVVSQSSMMMFNMYWRLGFQKLMEWQVFFRSSAQKMPSTLVIPQK